MKRMKTMLYTEDSEKIINEFKAVLPDGYGITVLDNGDVSGIGIKPLLEEIISSFEGEIGPVARFFVLTVGVAILVASARFVFHQKSDKIARVAEIGVCTVASVSLFSPLYAICTSVKETLCSVVDFLGSLIPVLTLVSTAEGAGESAAAQAMGLNFTLLLLEKLAVELLLPVSFALFTLSFVSAFASGGVASVIKGMKNLYTWGIGIISAVLAAVVTMQGVVASARDTALLRAARYAAGSMIPVVGNTVASALSTLGGGLALIKSSVGTSSVAVILMMTLTPLLYLLAHRAALSLGILFLEFTESEGGVRCFSSFRSALDSVIAVYCASCLVVLIQLVVFLFGGVRLG